MNRIRSLLFPQFPPSHGWGKADNESLLTWASLVTLIRMLGVMVGVGVAVQTSDIWWLYGGLAIYWLGDALDGIVARATHRETQLGALFDIVCDRLSVVLIYGAFCVFYPQVLGPVLAYLFVFVVLDSVLSLSFLMLGLLSINYYYLVDSTIYSYNWSMIAKVTTSTTFMIALILWQNPIVAGAIVAGVGGIKIWSLWRLHRVLDERARSASAR